MLAGQRLEKRLGRSDDVEATDLDRREMEYMFKDGSGGTFMDNTNFDQFTISEGVLGDALMQLRENA